jgi:hypothetical protein
MGRVREWAGAVFAKPNRYWTLRRRYFAHLLDWRIFAILLGQKLSEPEL